MPSYGLERQGSISGRDRFFMKKQPPTHAGSSLADFSTLKMEAIRSSETSVYTRSTRRHIPEDGILHSHRRENLKSYTSFFIFTNTSGEILESYLASYQVTSEGCIPEDKTAFLLEVESTLGP
jgi:hypothetical protein